MLYNTTMAIPASLPILYFAGELVILDPTIPIAPHVWQGTLFRTLYRHVSHEGSPK